MLAEITAPIDAPRHFGDAEPRTLPLRAKESVRRFELHLSADAAG